jgi:hypothetical protein
MIVLERSYLPHLTLGQLHIPGRTIVCLEPPWKDNAIGESCIPEGRYTLERDEDGRHRYFRIPDAEVDPRSNIEIHSGNTVEDSRGCIVPGLRFGIFDLRWSVGASRQACELMLTSIYTPEVLWIRQYRPGGL